MGKRRGLTAQQKAVLEQLKEQMPAELVPGFRVYTSDSINPESPWVKRMSWRSKALASNAYAYFNYDVRGETGIKKRRKTPRRVLSADGFPADITVSYAYPPPYAFKSPYNLRKVEHFVLHSFGHVWHAIKGPGTKNRWMNNYAMGRGVVPLKRGDGSTIYVPKGSDPVTLENFARFKNGFQSLMHSAATACAHFFIDRGGNLVVVGDCNDMMWTSPNVNETCISVEIEEAFYVLEDTREVLAEWGPGGNPAGTVGNVKYFGFSPQQMLTLSILVRKIETMYPALKGRGGKRYIGFAQNPLSSSSPPGYSMHNWLLNAKHMDISPHFLTQDLWDSFFALVDAQNHITKDMCFRPANYEDSTQGDVGQFKSLSEYPFTSLTERAYNQAKENVQARYRSVQLARVDKKTVNTTAGRNAVRASKQVSKEVATTVKVAQRTQKPIVDLPQQPTATADGFVAGYDDMWSYS